MPERMTREEAKIEQAIRAARIAKQKLLEETRNAFPLEDGTEVVKVKRPKAENVTIKVPNQKKEGFGLAGVEEEYKIKKNTDLPDNVKEAMDKVTEELTRALKSVDHNVLLSIMLPHGRGKEMFKDKDELIEHLVQNTIKQLKRNKGVNWDGRESSPASLKKTDSRYINSEYSDMDDSELMDLVMDKIGSMSKIELIEILER